MNRDQALKIIEAFGNGVPPDTYVGRFTVGRESDIRQLRELLHGENPNPLLLQADAGSGKTHSLRLIRETALEEGFAVSLVTLDYSSETSFHKMDLIVGAVCRGIELPGRERKGIRTLMDMVSEKIYDEQFRRDPDSFWTQLSNNWRWDMSELLESPCLYIALRAWVFGGDGEKDLIEDWLSYPWNYYSDRQRLVRELIGDMKEHFVDRRPPRELFSMKTSLFRFDLLKYVQCWDVLHDLRTLSKEVGCKDFVMLFDRADDVVDNLNNLRWQKIAFKNMLKFFSVDEFGGRGLFAASPEFREKCRDLLIRRGGWSDEFAGLENLPAFRIHEIATEELNELARRIAEAYGIAYGCEDRIEQAMEGIDEVVKRTASLPVPEKTRLTVRAIVEHLDHAFGEDE